MKPVAATRIRAAWCILACALGPLLAADAFAGDRSGNAAVAASTAEALALMQESATGSANMVAKSTAAAARLSKAFALLRTAARAGDPLAACHLGRMYRDGLAVPRNARAAWRWLRFAAERDVPDAMFALAQLYLRGDGVARDDLAARRWIEKAADLDYPDAVMAMALGLRDGSMGFERNEPLAELQMKYAARAMRDQQGAGRRQ